MITVGQAAFGEKDLGHALLGASPAATGASSIVHQTDIQGTPPPGTSWDAYWSLFRASGDYVVARTAPDPTAKRAGMVRTRALLIPVGQVGKLESLEPVMKFLLDHFDDEGPYSDVVVDAKGGIGIPSTSMVELLVRGARPVIWSLGRDFVPGLQNLWHHLWPAARAALTVRLAFSPQDIAGDPTIVVTPPALAPRWTEFHLVQDGEASVDHAVAMLTGEPGGENISRMVQDLGVGDKLEVRDLGQLVEITQALEDAGDLSDVIVALRLACHLAPDPAQGTGPKAALVSRAVERMTTSTVLEIRMARNLILAPVNEAAKFWAALKKWSETRLFRATPSDVLTTLVDATNSEGPVIEWRNAVLGGVRAYVKSGDDTVARSIWPIVKLDPRIAELFFSPLHRATDSLEQSMSNLATEDNGIANGKGIREMASRLNLPLLHAAVCAATLEPTAAAQTHLSEVEATPQSKAACLRRASASQIIAAATNFDDDVFTAMAAEKASVDVSLLRSLTVSKPLWRRLWSESLKRNADAWQGPKDPQTEMRRLLDMLMDGELTDYDLAIILSGTPLADQIENPRRTDLWQRLPDEIRRPVLDATLKSWIDQFAKNAGERPEPELASALLQSQTLQPLLDHLVSTPSVGLRLFLMFDGIDETSFRCWFDRVLGRQNGVSQEVADSVGRLVSMRGWHGVAHWLADRSLGGRSDLRPAMRYCTGMLNWFQRFLLDLPGEEKERAKWGLLEEIGCDLYSYGPGAQDLWGRAGGKDSEIPRASSGREGWRLVVREMERGRGSVDVRRLIDTMASDYPHNRVLRKIQSDRLFK